MRRDNDNLANAQWVAQCTRLLRRQWPCADVMSLEETALDLSRDATLQGMSADDAVALWLWPLRPGRG